MHRAIYSLMDEMTGWSVGSSVIIRKKLRNMMTIFIKIIDIIDAKLYNKTNNKTKSLLYTKEVRSLRISYKKLWIMLIEKEISPVTLRKDLNIATGTMTKLRRNEEVALSVLLRICEYLDCNIGDICDAVKIEND